VKPDVVLLESPKCLAAWRDRLTSAERDRMAAFPSEKRRHDWLLGRVAAKAAVRRALRRRGRPAPSWVEIAVGSSEAGAPRVQLPGGEALALALSLSHGHGRAAAWATTPGPRGGLPGVDLERIRPRPEGTLRFYLHPEERAWVDPLEPGDDAPGPRDVAAVVLWSLKEAAFKALQPPRGLGLLDVALVLSDPWDAPSGRAEVTYRGGLAERAAAHGVGAVRAGWRREPDDLCLAWVGAVGGWLPD